ncbi:MAG: glutamate/gamma-aminobutyrate family transporter YjeM [Cellulosilyticaceae bacterium]
MSNNTAKKLTLVSLVLMIFTSVYGFANMPRAFYLMGYAAIPWYLFGAIGFFLPYAFMMAEYGAAFKSEKGGIFSWMQRSVGPKYAFVGTFMWFASYIIWQVNVSSSIWVPLSTAVFGKDITQELHFLGLQGTQVLGLLGIGWIILVTFVATRGLDKIKKVTSLGGLAITALNIILFIGGITILVLSGNKLAQPIADGLNSFTVSPNPKYHSTLSTISFLTFAIFAYGGIEAIGGLVDQTENAQKTFPKGVAISAIVISIGYALGIFMIGIFTNWETILAVPGVTTANVTYIVMQNFGFVLSSYLGASEPTALVIGEWVGRFVGLSMFLALSGAFFTLIYAPLKQLIEGTPKELWPEKFSNLENGMPVYAMKIQAIIVIVLIALVSFGGESAAAFFDKLIIMTNVAMTIPYMFLAAAFPFFKKKTEIQKPFEVYKNYTISLIVAIVVTCVVGFANIFSIIEPGLAKGNWIDTILSGGGPLLFVLIALFLYNRYEKNHLNN